MKKIKDDLKANVRSYKFWMAVFSMIAIGCEFIAKTYFHVSISTELNGTISNLINTLLVLMVGLGVIDNKPVDTKDVNISDTLGNIQDDINEIKNIVFDPELQKQEVEEKPKVITPTITYYPKEK